MIKEFRDFIERGNLVELAVAFVMGGAFAALMTSFVESLLMPIVFGLFGAPSFEDLVFKAGEFDVPYGLFLTALVTFLLIALGLFFVVKAYNKMQEAAGTDEGDDEGPSEVDLLTEIRDSLAK